MPDAATLATKKQSVEFRSRKDRQSESTDYHQLKHLNYYPPPLTFFNPKSLHIIIMQEYHNPNSRCRLILLSETTAGGGRTPIFNINTCQTCRVATPLWCLAPVLSPLSLQAFGYLGRVEGEECTLAVGGVGGVGQGEEIA